MTRCPSCGMPVTELDIYCDHCGAAIGQTAGSPYQVYRYDKEYAKDHKAYASATTTVIRVVINLGLPLVLLAVFWKRFLAQGIGVIVLLLVGLLAFTGRDLWQRRHALRASRHALVWDRPKNLLYDVDMRNPEDAQDVSKIVETVSQGTHDQVTELTDRRVKWRSFQATTYTYLVAGKGAREREIPHAFAGMEEVDRA